MSGPSTLLGSRVDSNYLLLDSRPLIAGHGTVRGQFGFSSGG
jgi:hypothetical protein